MSAEQRNYLSVSLIGNKVEKMEKLININNDNFWQILFDEACVEGKQAERIEKELEKISIAEQEIRNKAIEEFAERLKDSLAHKYRHLLEVDADGFEWLTTDAISTHIDEIAESMKGEKE